MATMGKLSINSPENARNPAPYRRESGGDYPFSQVVQVLDQATVRLVSGGCQVPIVVMWRGLVTLFMAN